MRCSSLRRYSPDVPKVTLYRIRTNVPDLHPNPIDNPTPLMYIGNDIARDAFELYVRLVIHFEYVCHITLLGQLEIDVKFDPGVRILSKDEALSGDAAGD